MKEARTNQIAVCVNAAEVSIQNIALSNHWWYQFNGLFKGPTQPLLWTFLDAMLLFSWLMKTARWLFWKRTGFLFNALRRGNNVKSLSFRRLMQRMVVVSPSPDPTAPPPHPCCDTTCWVGSPGRKGSKWWGSWVWEWFPPHHWLLLDPRHLLLHHPALQKDSCWPELLPDLSFAGWTAPLRLKASHPARGGEERKIKTKSH